MPSRGYSAVTNERDLKMGSPRPVEGRARYCGYQGSSSDGRLGPKMGGSRKMSRAQFLNCI